MMLASLTRLFYKFTQLRDFEDENINLKARLLNVNLTTILILTPPLLLIFAINRSLSPLNLFIDVLAYAFIVILRLLLNHGQVRLVSNLEIIALWLFATINIIVFGSIRAISAFIYVFIIILSGVLHTRRTVIFIAGINCMTIGALIAAENASLLPSPNYHVGISQWLIFIGILAGSVAAIDLSMQVLQQANYRTKKLNEIISLTNSSLDVKVLLERVTRLGMELLAADAGSLSLMSVDGEEIEELFDYSIPPLVYGKKIAKGQGATWEVFENRRPIMTSNYSAISSALPELVEAGLEKIVACPIIKGDLCMGTLGVLRKRDRPPFTDRDLSTLKTLAQQTATAIENARLYADLENELLERQRAEAEIRLLNAQLEQKVVERTRQLEGALKELESISYSVSHDLRSPLRAIDGYSQFLLEDESNTLSKQAQEHLASIRRSAQHMGLLLDNMVQLMRITRLPLEKVIVSLSALAQVVASELSALEPNREIDVTIQSGLQARGDPTMLRMVLEVLLGNSWKFTRSRSPNPAWISFGAEVKDGRTIYSVSDNGIGFEMEHVEKIFLPFERLHRFDEFPGTGVGLTLAKRVINRHGGEIWARSTPGDGATFFFTLPD